MGNTAPLWKKSFGGQDRELCWGSDNKKGVLESDIKVARQYSKNETKVFLSPGVRHNVSESSSLQELHDDPELVSHQVAVVHLHHVLVVIVPHDYNLQSPQKQMDKHSGYRYFTLYL